MDELSAALGERYETMRISLKFYSCVGSNHTTLDAIRAMQSRRPFTIDELERIVVHGSQVTVDHVGWPYRPEGLTSAQLNLPFCVATLLLHGDVFVDQFTPDAVHDETRIALSRRVEVVHDSEITALGSKFRHKVRVELYLKDGYQDEETREAPRGSEQSFATAEEIVEKFRKLTRGVISPEQQADIVDLVIHMEDYADMKRLAEVLGARLTLVE